MELGTYFVASTVAICSQYYFVRKNRNDLFSTLVCLLAIVANCNRVIAYWSWHPEWIYTTCYVAIIGQHLALLELITRVRREERMLPSTHYHRLSLTSFRLKSFVRHFFMWDDFLSYIKFFGVICGVFVLLHLMLAVPRTMMLHYYFSGVKWTSEILELLQGVPLALKHRADGTTEGTSVGFILGLLAASLAKVVFGNYSAHFYLPLLSVVVSGALLYQFRAYSRVKHHAF